MAVPDTVTVPNNTDSQRFIPASFLANSVTVLNPNDGICYVARDRRCISTQVGAWDWKVPSQSYAHLPGPFRSVGLFYQDRSGSGLPGEISTYATTQKIELPDFSAIGRAQVANVTSLDIGQGSQPQNPPANNVRLWADASGNLHRLLPNGSDAMLIDSSNIAAQALGGDLTGTIGAGHISVQPSGTIVMAGTANMAWTGSNIVIQQWNANQIGLRASGGVTMNGNLVVEGSSALQVGGAGSFGTSLQVGTTLGVSGGATFGGTVTLNADNVLTFGVNGYYWKGIAGYPVVYTQGSIGAGGGHLYLSSALAAPADFYWDGSYFHIPAGSGLVVDSHIYNRAGDGSYYSGSGDQTIFGIWNPGELRNKSSASANLRAALSTFAEGGPAHGFGAYVNDASSVGIKTNVVELDPAISLAAVLDVRLRPVSFQYVTRQAPFRYVGTETEPNPNAPLIDYPDERLGFLVEEVISVVPQAVTTWEATGEARGLSSEVLIPLLWSALRNIDGRLKQLEAHA